jgi:hypothetical protein
MLSNRHFYHRTIRKIVVAFGTIFNDIQLVRYTKDQRTERERFKVPLSYGSKEKYMTRITTDPDLTKSVQIVVPRISFEMTGISYDASRKQMTSLRNFAPATANTSTRLNTQFAPIPYDFNFSLSIYVRNTEDGTQILEQILPFFTPDFNVTVDFIPEMNQKYDLPIILNSVNPTTDYEGDFMTTRLITWDLEFTVKGYIWPSVNTSRYIRQANTNIYLSEDPTNYISTSNNKILETKTTPNPPTAEIDDEFGFSEETTDPSTPQAIILITEDGFELITEDSRFKLEA